MISERSLKLFKEVADNIPAYKQFLSDHNCSAKDIKSVESFNKMVPLSDKKSYLSKNKQEDLIWKSDLNDLLLFCATSGSTGEPYYFPRNEQLSKQYSYLIEDYLKYSSYGRGKTLVIIGFGMGVWIGGIITLRAFEIAAQRMKAPIAILPTGFNKTEIFKALKKLAPDFDQTVIVGYPPFVKELVDEASSESIDLAKLKVRFLFAAESFTELFRDYVCQKAGITNPLRDTLNVYGSADNGAMAYETPLSILIRRLILDDPFLRKDVFRQIEKTPTLAQYNPDYIEFEEVNGEIVLTADGALPLIRYAIGDHGGVFDYGAVFKILKQYNIDLDAEIMKSGIAPIANKNYPFVFVYERKDLTATLQGINIYPEFIKEGLLQDDFPRYFTQRFQMSTKYTVQQDQFLQINLELQKNITSTKELERMALKTLHAQLVEKSSEFAEVSKNKSSTKLLQIKLWPNGHHRYFAAGTKQKWVEKRELLKKDPI